MINTYRKLSLKEAFLFLFLISIIVLTSLIVGWRLGYSSWYPNWLSNDKSINDFNRAFNIVNNNFIGNFNINKGIEKSIKSLVSSLGDDYSYYLSKDEYQEFLKLESGNFTGIGIIYDIEFGTPKIIEVLPNSPAEKVGIKAGDSITKVDQLVLGEAITNEKVVDLLKGEIGTTVLLELKDMAKVRSVKVIREKFNSFSVTSKLLDNNIFYIKIYQFDETTKNDFEEAIKSLIVSGYKNLILDLRNNPGGLTDSAFFVADSFISDGIIYRTANKNGDEKIYSSTNTVSLEDMKVVILTNSYTASSAEIVASALQENNRATIVGEKTKGKANQQMFFELKDGSAINLTVNKWLTSSGKSLDKEGLTPDIEIKDENLVNDKILQKALDII